MHCHQSAASAGQRHPEQRRAAEPIPKGTQVGHLTHICWSLMLLAVAKVVVEC